MIKTCLLGLGRTGVVVAEQLIKSPEFDLSTVMVRPHSPKKGKLLCDFILNGTKNTIESTELLYSKANKPDWDVAIDFTSAEVAVANARKLAENGVNLVIGTTGFNQLQLHELKRITQRHKVGMVYAPNISLGINLMLSIARTISRLIPNYDVEITESHHRHKKDSPSGTAMKLAHEIATARDNQHYHYSHGRKGSTLREENEIGVHAIRAGGIVGVHQVLFAGESDEIEITHRSYSRAVFAEGALRAARFICNRQGFYDMEDVLQEELTANNLNDHPEVAND